MQELVRLTVLLRPHRDALTDRYSEQRRLAALLIKHPICLRLPLRRSPPLIDRLGAVLNKQLTFRMPC